MNTKRILLIDTLHSTFKSGLEERGFIVDEGYNLSRENILDVIHLYDGIAIRSRFFIDPDFIRASKNLKFIARAGSGLENIDNNAAAENGIQLIHAKEGNRDAVGEHAIAMILSLFNNLNRADIEVRQFQWNRESNRGIELNGKTIGIIGFGNMGSSFAKKLGGFDVKILAYDPYITINTSKYINVIQCDLQEIFNSADILSLHVPLTSETSFMVEKNFINRFKKSIYIINTSRGKVLKVSDLCDCIDSKKVLGACLDVLEYESLSFETMNNDNSSLKRLFSYPNTVFSPHIAGWTHESNIKIAQVLIEKICSIY